MKALPNVLSENLQEYNDRRLSNEAQLLNRMHALPRTLGEWLRRREEIKSKIREIAFVDYDPSLDLEFRIAKTMKCDGYSVNAVEYRTRRGIMATASLYVPDGEGPFPGVLNLHGHSKEGRRMAYIQARGRSFAKNGYVCLSPDTWGMGERSTTHEEYEYHGSIYGGALFLLGESMLGALLADNLRAVDLLCSLPYVDKENLAVTGESGGGNQTMWLGAMDERLKVVMPVVSVGSFESYVTRSNCVCEVLPGGLREFEEDAVLALVAPRTLCMFNALRDSNPTFYVQEMMRSYRRAKEVFRLYGKEQNISFMPFDTEHGYKPEMREAALGFLDSRLKGIGNGLPRSELPYETVPDFDGMAVYPKGERPAGFGSVSEYCMERFAQLRARDVEPLPPAEERAEIRRVLAMGEDFPFDAVHLGSAGEPNVVFERRCEPFLGERRCYTHAVYEVGEEGATFSRWLLKNSRGLAVPCLVRDAARAGGATYVMAATGGKPELAKSPLLQKLIGDPSARLVLIDLFSTGENDCFEIEECLAAFHTPARALLWLGRSMIGEWTNCYRMAASFAGKTFGNGKTVYFGRGEAGVAAMAAACLDEGDAAFEGEEVPESFAWAPGERLPDAWRTCAEFVYGFAAWGDVARLRKGLARKQAEKER